MQHGADTANPPENRQHEGPRKFHDKPWWTWFKRVGGIVFFLLVAGLLVSQARRIEWDKVLNSLENYPVSAAWSAVLLVVASFLLYSCFDLLGRHYTRHKLGTRTVLTTTFVSYVFNLNLGSVVGGVAMRYRLYSRLGLKTGVITRIMSLSMLTNWMGYLLLGGLLFSFYPPELPDTWKIDSDGLRMVGFALLAVVAGYLAICTFLKKRKLTVRGHTIDLPSLRLASLQLVMGAGNWLIMSGIIFILLQHRIELPAVAAVLLLAAIAGVITHIPGNLGVLEAVFVALLSDRIPGPELLAALVAYRVIYYLVPLGIASVMYVLMEGKAKKVARRHFREQHRARHMATKPLH